MSDRKRWGRTLFGGTPIEAERWRGPYRELMEIFSAPDPEELDRRAGAFPRAFRAFRGALFAQHCDPARNGGRRFRDVNLEPALRDLWRAAMAAKCGDPFADRAAFDRRGALAGKINGLVPKSWHIPK